MVVVKMIIGNYSWMTNAELLNEVTVVNSKLLNHGIHLGFSMDDTKRHHVTLKVVSSYDDGIFIVDDKSINTATNSFVNTMKNRLRIIANRVEFLAFVIESVSKMKELDEHLLVGNLTFKCSRKTDDGEVIFVFERGIYAFGGGTFNYCKANNSVELILDIEDLDTEVTSVDIEDLPKELKIRLNLDHIDGFDTLTVSGTLTKEYERLTIGASRDSAKDVIEAIRYLEKL
jgi:hypothetical protein